MIFKILTLPCSWLTSFHSLVLLQFSSLQQPIRWESATSFECIGAVWCDVGDGDDRIHYDHFPTMARIGVRYCGGIINIHIDLFTVAHAEGRGFGVRMKTYRITEITNTTGLVQIKISRKIKAKFFNRLWMRKGQLASVKTHSEIE